MSVEGRGHILELPLWHIALRAVQIVLSIIILGLAASLGGGFGVADAPALAIATAVFTWIIVAYDIVTVRVPTMAQFYHIIAVLALDGFLIILWLATWARSADIAAVTKPVQYCFDGTCYDKRDLQKRYMSWKTWNSIIAAVAGLGALIWLTFIGTFVWTLMAYLKGNKEGRFPLVNTTSEAHQMEEAKAPAAGVAPAATAAPVENGAQPQQYAEQVHTYPEQAQHPQEYAQMPAHPQEQEQYPPVGVPAPHQ